MTYQIALGTGGLAGWNILKRTADAQKQLIANDPVVSRSSDYFTENIAKAETAGDLVKDYKLLNVALRAYGLEGDINNQAFIRKVLESDLNNPRSLVNRLSDKRYLKFAQAFHYSDTQNTLKKPDFGADMSARYLEREFERRVGEADDNLRLALNTKRELANMSGRNATDKTLWYEVLGNPPLREVFATALGFDPDAISKIPLDQQVSELMNKAERMFGDSSIKIFSDEQKVEKLIQNFLVRSQFMQGSAGQNSYSIALSLLSGSNATSLLGK